jgi:hypothetical protein
MDSLIFHKYLIHGSLEIIFNNCVLKSHGVEFSTCDTMLVLKRFVSDFTAFWIRGGHPILLFL